MALLLTETDVRSLLTMPLALEAVEAGFRRMAEGKVILHSRQRLALPGRSYLHYMAAGDAVDEIMGMKIYTSSRRGLRFVVPLFDSRTGDLLALLEADYLGQMRTGAASGLATRLMARSDAQQVGLIGTGRQARTQLIAVAAVRPVSRIRVFGRDPERRTRFAAEMSEELGVPVEPVSSGEEAVSGAQVVVTATTASNPVVLGKWLAPGAHINAIGANFPHKSELDREAVERADFIAVDSREQSRLEAGDLIQAFANEPGRWNAVWELADLVAGRIPGRTGPDQITLFKSNGIALEDIVVAARLLRMAQERGIGKSLRLWESPHPA